MKYWIFRGNREDFDIDTYLRDFDYIYWAVKHKKHQRELQLDDQVFIWRSKGKSTDPYGVVALGKVVETPVHKHFVKHPEFLLEEYWEKREVSEIKVGLRLESSRLNLESGLIDSSLLLKDERLRSMQLLTARQGTNFSLTSFQFDKIYSLWHGDIHDPEEEDYSSEEGKAKLRLHKVRERDQTLIRKAKERFIKNNGKLFCEACGFDFMPVYGFGYAEAHHKKPISTIKAGEKTSVSDIGILCANCHRAVHRLRSADPWPDLLKVFRNV